MTHTPHTTHHMETERHPNHNLDYCTACGLSEHQSDIVKPCSEVPLVPVTHVITQNEYREFLRRVWKASSLPGNFLFYDGHLMESPKWRFSFYEISVSDGNVTYVLQEYDTKVNSDFYERMQAAIKVLTAVDLPA